MESETLTHHTTNNDSKGIQQGQSQKKEATATTEIATLLGTVTTLRGEIAEVKSSVKELQKILSPTLAEQSADTICFNCEGRGHRARHCREEKRCHICSSTKHVMIHCPYSASSSRERRMDLVNYRSDLIESYRRQERTTNNGHINIAEEIRSSELSDESQENNQTIAALQLPVLTNQLQIGALPHNHMTVIHQSESSKE